MLSGSPFLTKKAFSLVEIIIVVAIVAFAYFLSVSTFNSVKEKKLEDLPQKVTIDTIKEHLLKIPYEKSISLKCIDNATKCLLFVDGNLTKVSYINVFEEAPTIYKYDEGAQQIELEYLELKDLEHHFVHFEITLDKHGRHKDFIVETKDGVYYFNPTKKKPQKFEFLNEVIDYISHKTQEVKDAF